MIIRAEKIKELASAAGVNQLGITGPEPLSYMEERLRERIREGRLTRFEEKDPHKRFSPQHIMKECRSILVLAISYNLPGKEPKWPVNEPRGLVARCARGIDYHAVILNRAEQIVSMIKKDLNKPFKYQILCDRSPLLERELACRAGLGWIGKNCTLINQNTGSYNSLATILTDLNLESDTALQQSCPDCGRCIRNCPTEAIVEPYILNPHRCLSYQTQLSGVFPRSLRPLLKNMIYGCDRCQEICPANERMESYREPAFSFPLFPAEPLLLPLLEISRREYDLTIGLTSAGWRGKTTLQRNVIIALGNSKEDCAVKPLARLLESDPRPLIRLHAAWALGSIGGSRAFFCLDKSRHNDPEAKVRSEAITALEGNF